MKNAILHLAFSAAVALVAAPGVLASDLDKKTIITFSEAVEIPGAVLPAGEYVIKRADPSMPDVIRFMNSDETQVFATVRALTTTRPAPAEELEIAFEERASNAPQALKKWFYPGDLTGSEFVYSDSDEVMMASNYTPLTSEEPTSSAASSARITAEPNPLAQGQAGEMNTPSEIAQAQPAPAQTTQPYAQPQRTAQPAPAQESETTVAEELPATASRLPLAASLGILSIFAGACLRRRLSPSVNS